MVTYRNTFTGRLAQHEGPVRYMDEAARWERVSEPEANAEPRKRATASARKPRARAKAADSDRSSS